MAAHLLVFVNTVGMMAICTIFYGVIQRRVQSFVLRRVTIGFVLGCGGVLIMAQPITLNPGFQADARGAFVGIAAAFGGPLAAMTAVALTVVARAFMGGSGVTAGALVIAATAAGGLLWRHHVGSKHKRVWAEWLLISLICIGPSAIALLAVAGTAWRTSIFLSLVIGLVVFIFGKMLETEQRRGRRERELTQQASTDCLTGLPNRRSLEDHARTLEEEGTTGVLFLLLDIDHFKKINDTHGHAAGDAVLREIGSAIRRTVRDTDFAARWGGEEFAVIIRSRNADAGRLVAERFRKALRVPVGTTQQTCVSIGGCLFDEELFSYCKAYQLADAALYASKARGRDCVTLLQAEHEGLLVAC